MRTEERHDREVDRKLKKFGNDPAIVIFLSKYLNPTTQAIYIDFVSHYFDWLADAKDVHMTPSEVVKDSLVCLFKSHPTDRDWRNEKRP